MCINGVCTSPTCSRLTGKPPGSISCGTNNSCYCAEDPSGNGFYISGDRKSCNSVGAILDECLDNEPYTSGTICTTSPHYRNKIYIKATSRGAAKANLQQPQPSSPFPPVPVSLTPLTGWVFNVQIPDGTYIANDYSLDKSMYLRVNGTLMVNTHYLLVKEAVPNSGLLGDGTVIPKNTIFGFKIQMPLNPNTCCLAVFKNTKCDPHGSP